MEQLTKEKFDKIINRIALALETYKRFYARDNQYKIYLANGERLEYRFDKMNIPHLLGLKFDSLKTNGIISKSDSNYEATEKIIQNSYDLYKNITSGNIQFNSVFSDYIDNKLDIFENIITPIEPNKVCFVVKYDPSKTYMDGVSEAGFISDYYIVQKKNFSQKIMLGLDRLPNFRYVPKSAYLITSENEDEIFKKLLKKQEITFISNIKTENPSNGYKSETRLPLEEKIIILNALRNIKRRYLCTIDTNSDNEFALKVLASKQSSIRDNKSMLISIISALESKDLIEIEDIDDDELKELIEKCNNLLVDSTDKHKSTYTDIKNENEELKKRVELLDNKLQTSELQAKTRLEEIEYQKAELNSYKEAWEGIRNSFEKGKELILEKKETQE